MRICLQRGLGVCRYTGASLQASRFACSTLDKLQPRVVSYEEQVTAIREQLADVLIDEEDWNQAAKTLAGIDLDSGDCPAPPAHRRVEVAFVKEHTSGQEHLSSMSSRDVLASRSIVTQLPSICSPIIVDFWRAQYVPDACCCLHLEHATPYRKSYIPAGMRQVDDEYKLKQNVRIAMLYLEDDDAVNAEVFIKKAATLIANCKASPFPGPVSYPATLKFPCQLCAQHRSRVSPPMG